MTQSDPYGRTPLHYAGLENVVDCVMTLLAEGSDVNAADIQGFTPLHLRVKRTRSTLVVYCSTRSFVG